jgi:hypothetical protein
LAEPVWIADCAAYDHDAPVAVAPSGDVVDANPHTAIDVELKDFADGRPRDAKWLYLPMAERLFLLDTVIHSEVGRLEYEGLARRAFGDDAHLLRPRQHRHDWGAPNPAGPQMNREVSVAMQGDDLRRLELLLRERAFASKLGEAQQALHGSVCTIRT